MEWPDEMLCKLPEFYSVQGWMILTILFVQDETDYVLSTEFGVTTACKNISLTKWFVRKNIIKLGLGKT